MEKFSDSISSMDSLRAAAPDNLLLNNRSDEKVKMEKMCNELQLLQVELEMQNERLQQSAHEAELFSTGYFDLFDCAPVGLFTSDKTGIIKNANSSLSQLLGEDKRNLINKKIQSFIHFSYTDSYFYFIKHVMHSSTKQILELNMVKKDGSNAQVLLETIKLTKADFGLHELLTAVVDITSKKQD